jgi:WD40 repeat protein
VVFTPDSTKLISAVTSQTIKVWEVTTGKLLASYQAHDGWVLFVTFCPDGNILASSGGDGLIKLWETKKETWECIATLRGHNAWVWSLDFSPDGQFIVSGGSDSQIRLWKVSSLGQADLCQMDATSYREVASLSEVGFIGVGQGQPGSQQRKQGHCPCNYQTANRQIIIPEALPALQDILREQICRISY